MKIFLIIAFLVILPVIFLIWKNKAVLEGEKTGSVCFNDRCFRVEIASSFLARAKGLMFRKSLAPESGMLFIFPNAGIYPFWMKNTLIPLDMVWIDENKEAVHIAENVRPCGSLSCPRVSPGREAKYVLELNAGKAGEIGLKPGGRLEFDLR